MLASKGTVHQAGEAEVDSWRALPATITGNVAALLLDVDAHKLPNPVAAPQMAEGSGKAHWLAVNAQDGSIENDQRSSPVPAGSAMESGSHEG